MKNLIRSSRNLLPKTKRWRRLGCFLLLLLVVIVPFTIYFVDDQESLRQLANNGINLFPHNPPGQTLTLPPFSTASSTAFPTATASPQVLSKACGIKINPGGSYTFSWLHVSNGRLFDEHNCPVHLLGVNMGGLFLGSAGHSPPSAISWYAQHIPMNVVREAYNAYWWDTNVYVPDERMHFQQWLETVVKWQEQQGNYVILDNATQFHNPPCGDDGMGYHVSLCPSQNQASKNIPPDPTEKSSYQPTALTALASLAKLYANDPAIIFDVWNEPSNSELQGLSEQTYLQYMNQRINTVRQYSPRSLVMVYNRDEQYIESGRLPNFSQSNLMWDTHIYDPNWAPTKGASTNVAFAQNHNQAFIVGEWGGQFATPEPATLMPFVKATDIASAYFGVGDLANGPSEKPNSLNSIGQQVAQAYTSIFESP